MHSRVFWTWGVEAKCGIGARKVLHSFSLILQVSFIGLEHPYKHIVLATLTVHAEVFAFANSPIKLEVIKNDIDGFDEGGVMPVEFLLLGFGEDDHIRHYATKKPPIAERLLL